MKCKEEQDPDLPSILNKFMQNASQNLTKTPTNRRFDEVITKFVMLLFIYAGPLAYCKITCKMLFPR
jgi:hypothetical protein